MTARNEANGHPAFRPTVEVPKNPSDTIFEAVPIPLMILEGDLRVRSANRAYYHVFQTSAPETESRCFHELGNGQWAVPRLQELLGQIVSRNTRIENFEVEGHFPRIGLRTMLLHANRVVPGEGESAHVLLTLEDVTVRKQAEAQLRLQGQVAANLAEGVMLVRAQDAVIAYTNARFEKLFGYGPGELVGKPVAILNAAGERSPDETAALIHQSLRETGVWRGEVHSVRKDGSTFWAFANVSTFDHPELGPVWVSASTDVSERKRAEHALRESEVRLQLAIYATNLGIFEHDHHTDALYWSPVLREIIGWSPDEPAALSEWVERIHPEERDEKVAAIRQAHDPAGDGLYSVEHRIVRRDGRVRWVHVCSRTFFEGAADTRRPVRTIGTVADVTEQKQAEQALWEASEFTRQVVNSVQEGFAVLDSTFRYSLWNAFMERLSGKLASQVLGKQPWDVFHFLPEAVAKPRLEAALSGETIVVPDTFTDPPVPGQAAWISQVLVPMRDVTGRVVGVLCSLHDVTARKQAEEARNRLAAIVESAEDAIISKTLDGTITSWNAGAERLLGYSASEVIGKNVSLILPIERQDEEPLFRGRIALSESVEHHETVRLHKSGRRVDVALSISPVRDSAGTVTGCAKIMHDVSARKLLEKEVLEIATREQRRIGHELHDTIGQELTALNLLADALVKTLDERASTEIAIANKLAGGLQRTLGQIRGIARGLVPVEVDSQGLLAALGELATRIGESSGVSCTLNCGRNSVEVDDNQTATHLFYVAQEAVTNAIRHGKPSRITLTLVEDDRAITLRIQDNGVGFPGEPVESGGMGLKIMHYRAGLINARLTVEPTDPVGTAVTCRLFKGTSDERERDSLK